MRPYGQMHPPGLEAVLVEIMTQFAGAPPAPEFHEAIRRQGFRHLRLVGPDERAETVVASQQSLPDEEPVPHQPSGSDLPCIDEKGPDR